ncbi:myosin light chain protein [Plakobranchus ocellatus]|uniref:Myosin light chain protein n=1 Tax=Plakobranchus ocellatus TaxID=259542 RepID=A0AAV3Z4E8_9GAST|nr:myosin light chain protein [Plakobranchus ocellatus]
MKVRDSLTLNRGELRAVAATQVYSSSASSPSPASNVYALTSSRNTRPVPAEYTPTPSRAPDLQHAAQLAEAQAGQALHPLSGHLDLYGLPVCSGTPPPSARPTWCAVNLPAHVSQGRKIKPSQCLRRPKNLLAIAV